jgi:AraC family transcriptional regulator
MRGENSGAINLPFVENESYIIGLMQSKFITNLPYLFRQEAEWTGVNFLRARVMPGRMHDCTSRVHKIRVAIKGEVTTRRISGNGKLISTRGGVGNICLTPAGQSIGARWEKPIDAIVIALLPEFVRETAVENQLGASFELVEIYKKKDLLLTQLALALFAEASSDTPSGRLYADSLIQTLTLHVLKSYSTAPLHVQRMNGGLPGYKLRRVKEFIDEHLDHDLGLAELSRVASLSQFHFARAFRKSTGLTPQHYLMERRIERAKQLLTDAELPLVEVSLRTGFKNQSHFTTLFRKFTNVTPKTWRELKLA